MVVNDGDESHGMPIHEQESPTKTNPSKWWKVGSNKGKVYDAWYSKHSKLGAGVF